MEISPITDEFECLQEVEFFDLSSDNYSRNVLGIIWPIITYAVLLCLMLCISCGKSLVSSSLYLALRRAGTPRCHV